MKVNIAGITHESIVDGPGIRLVIYAQGCLRNCKYCHNPQTHALDGGTKIKITELVKIINNSKLIRGVTFSGGEPLLQAQGFSRLAKFIKRQKYDLVVYSGFLFNEIMVMANTNKYIKILLQNTDILIDGPYIASRRDLRLAFRGSNNQRLINVPKSLIAGNIIEWENEEQNLYLI